jgi:uncharacterized protein
MRIIDARARPPIAAFRHDPYANLEDTLADSESRGWTPTRANRSADLGDFLREVDDCGVDRVGIPARVENKMYGGAESGEVLAACTAEERFFGYAAVDPTHPGAADSIAGLVAEGAAGIVVEPGLAEPAAQVDDRRFGPVWEACVAAAVPALVQAGGGAGPDYSYSDPVALERLAARFPNLQIVNVHGGWPFVQPALGVAYRRPNVWMLADFYFPGLPGHDDYVRAMGTYLQDRFLFASSFPSCPLAEVIDRYGELGLPAPVLEKVMGGNAARLFDL